MPQREKAQPYAMNLRRLMARRNMTTDEVVRSTGLHRRTVRELLRGRSKPHARTLYRLSTGLGVSTDEFFCRCPEIGDLDGAEDQEVLEKVDLLLRSDQRSLFIELVELLTRCATPDKVPPEEA